MSEPRLILNHAEDVVIVSYDTGDQEAYNVDFILKLAGFIISEQLKTKWELQ